MKKGIIVLTGTPQGISTFSNLATQYAWVLRANVKKAEFTDKRGQENEKLSAGKVSHRNKQLHFEKTFIQNRLTDFLSISSIKKFRGREYDRFVLLVTGLDKKLYRFIEEEHGAFQLHVTSKKFKEQSHIGKKILHDYVMYYDDEDFSKQVSSVINILTMEE